MWRTGSVSYTHLDVYKRQVQKPHPPLWVACSQLETIELAGRCGIGALGFQFLSAEMANAWVHAYYNSFVLRQTKLADYQANCNIAMVSYFTVSYTHLSLSACGWCNVHGALPRST